jgi:hypothetical protein
LFLILYCIVDDLYPEVTPGRIRVRTGADRMDMTDPEIITLSIMQEGRSNDSKLSFHRGARKTTFICFQVSFADPAITADAKT